ncbi:MAG TPA: UDP-N-acetylmuramate dehydrogenase [Candidatus Avoscillospira avicola]|uniref:UDP-N-acetylenolpyruvoylglucosamine reductase n=1 Tax=Candidatus Avoscillospira avicola TaxID=2840706 RepID=A0A9D1APY8_9FIRM|nr:UDP-N-acetylmuramate dehydrogenase [Candidatus Avoscillospira avicola]
MMQKELFEALSQAFPGVKLVEAEPLKHRTSFRIGGPAPMAFPRSAAELAEMYRFLLARGCRALILGAGSNVLAPDAGLSRLILCTREMADLSLTAPGRITAECGVLLSRLASFARDRGLAGLEFAHGIPGTVGGGIYMNAGAYGGELKDVAVATEALLPDGTLWRAEGAAQEFSYRDSAFQRRGAVILKTEFALEPGDPAAITAKMQELAQRRRASQPLDLPSAGSTFKRPQGGYAAALIDQAGLKGRGVGGAAVSEKHAGFVVNLGGATEQDVLDTMDLVRRTVLEQSGISLEPEVRLWRMEEEE